MKKLFMPLFILQSFVCFAQWNDDPSVNTVVCSLPANQLYHEMIPDGSGGAIIAWENRSAALDSSQIYAQHLSKDGTLLWATGIAVSPSFLNITPYIISDGEGGAIISWLDFQNGIYKIYVQKISAAGQLQWPDGIAVCPNAKPSFYYKMISDANGGAVIIWPDSRDPTSQLYAQRISSAGAVVWQPDGVPCSSFYVFEFEAMADTATGGLFLSWPKVTNNYADIFVQKLSLDGAALWSTDGKNICHAPKAQFNNKIISDGKGGIVVLWQDFREDPVLSGIYGQRVDSSGTLYWDEDGKIICDSVVPAITLLQAVSDGDGGGIIAWLDDFIIDQTNINNLYAQRFDSSGVTLWPTNNKIAVWEDLNYKSPFQMTTDYNQGSFITWSHVSDTLPDGNEIKDIFNVYEQHVFAGGLTQWPHSGKLVSSAPMNQGNPKIVCDTNGIAIIAWSDLRSGSDYDIYAARLTDVILPVQWLSFAAESRGNSNFLKWKIANQYNSKGFFIERSGDGTHYKNIGFVSTKGDSYSFTDNHPLEGNNYYRLKQVDFDGSFKYSKVVRLFILLKEMIAIYPNPVSKILKVETHNTGAMLLQVLNAYGQVVKIKSIKAPGITEIDVSNLATGIYYLKTDSGEKLNLKLFIVKF